jgi:hypothetical protein
MFGVAFGDNAYASLTNIDNAPVTIVARFGAFAPTIIEARCHRANSKRVHAT